MYPVGPCSCMVYTWALKQFLCHYMYVRNRYLDPLGYPKIIMTMMAVSTKLVPLTGFEVLFGLI